MAVNPKCPRCLEPRLVVVSAGRTVVDTCPKCHGVWFDAEADELSRILEQGYDRLPDALKQSWQDSPDAGRLVLVPDPSEALQCPRCAREMNRYWYGAEPGKTFLIDACPVGHGVWLDQGELSKAKESLERFGKTRAELERKGAVDDALARAEGGDSGPRSVFQDQAWSILGVLLNTKVRGL